MISSHLIRVELKDLFYVPCQNIELAESMEHSHRTSHSRRLTVVYEQLYLTPNIYVNMILWHVSKILSYFYLPILCERKIDLEYSQRSSRPPVSNSPLMQKCLDMVHSLTPVLASCLQFGPGSLEPLSGRNWTSHLMCCAILVLARHRLSLDNN